MANIFFIQPIIALYANEISIDIAPGTWSLHPEMYFYLILPFLALLIKRLNSFTVVITILIAIGPIYRSYFFSNPNWLISYNFITFTDVFGFGMLAARLYVLHQNKWLIKYSNFISSIGILLFFYLWLPLPAFIIDREFQLGLSCFLFMSGLLPETSWFKKPLQTSMLRFVGHVSYSVFLVHITLIWYLIDITYPLHRFLILATVGTLLSIFLGAYMYKYIEKPFFEKGFIIKRALLQMGTPLLICIVCITLLVTSNNYLNFKTEALIPTSTNIVIDDTHKKVFDSRSIKDFNIYSSDNNGVKFNTTQNQNGFIVSTQINNNLEWIVISAKLLDAEIKLINEKEIIVQAKIKTNISNAVKLGIFNGESDIVGESSDPGEFQVLKLSSVIKAGPNLAQFKVNIFPKNAQNIEVEIIDFQIYIKELPKN